MNLKILTLSWLKITLKLKYNIFQFLFKMYNRLLFKKYIY